jgi:hypothetical protein
MFLHRGDFMGEGIDSSRMDLQTPGFGGRYEIFGAIASGGMGTVHFGTRTARAVEARGPLYASTPSPRCSRGGAVTARSAKVSLGGKPRRERMR